MRRKIGGGKTESKRTLATRQIEGEGGKKNVVFLSLLVSRRQSGLVGEREKERGSRGGSIPEESQFTIPLFEESCHYDSGLNS